MSTILIIGASSGIGKQLAFQLAESGNTVYGTYNQNRPEDATSGISYHHVNVLEDTLNFDFLPAALNGIVYCPGSINLKPVKRIAAKELQEDYALQLIGAVKVIQGVLPRLKTSDNASIVLFSTVAVQTGFAFHAAVSAAKGAVEGLTRSLAAEFAPAIRVNCIAPSLTDTPLASTLLSNEDKRFANANRHPLKRIGDVKDIAAMAEFLLSPKAGWISGQILKVDGGMSALKV